MRRQQMQSRQQQPMQQMQPMGGTMQMQPAQFGNMGGGGQSAMIGAMSGMPSASSMAEMLQRMQGAWGGKPEYAMSPEGSKVPVVDSFRPASGGGYS